VRRWGWVLVLAAGAGCGYRFTAGGAGLPEGIRSVCAPVLLNQTAEPGLEVAFTESLRAQLLRAGVAGGPGSCAGEISGELLNITSSPTVLTNAGAPASYRIQATARLRLTRGERVLSEATVSGTEEYLPPPESAPADVLQAEAQRQAALRRLAEVMMRDGYERLASAW